MPAVVRIAISEAISRTVITTRSTLVRARKSGRIRSKPKAPPAKAVINASTEPRMA